MILDSVIQLGEGELTERQWRKLLNALSFQTKDGEEWNAYTHEEGEGIVKISRGALNLIPKGVEIEDFRSRPKMPKLEFVRELGAEGYEGQVEAVAAMFKHCQGRVIAPPGKGKTEMGLAFMAAACTRSLVIVHSTALLSQWIERAKASIPGVDIGKIQGKTCTLGHITIAMAQTIRKSYLGAGGKFWRQFGAVIVDEAHHAAADTWEWLLNVCPAFYRIGLTASELRTDGLHPLVGFNIGPVIFRFKFQSQVPMTVQPIFTNFHSRYGANMMTKLWKEVREDKPRNEMIAAALTTEIMAGNTVLALSRYIEHLEKICDLLPFEARAHTEIVTGKMKRKDQDAMIQRMRDGDLRCILGTQLFEEGVDIARINRVALMFPGTWITALQKVGRGARIFEGKDDALVLDFVDDNVPVLARQYLGRYAWYKSVGITVAKAIKEGRDDATKESVIRRLTGKLGQLRPATPKRT